MNQNKIFWLSGLVMMFFFHSCMNAPLNQSGLTDTFIVMKTTPEDGSRLEVLDHLEIEFSAPYCEACIQKTPFVVLEVSDVSEGSFLTPDLDEQISKKEILPLSGTLAIQNEGFTLIWTPNIPFKAGTYQLVLTPFIMTEGYFPLVTSSQGALENQVITFIVEGDELISSFMPENEKPSDLNEQMGSDAGEPPSNEKQFTSFKRGDVILNEVLYDPVGSDSLGNEFVEIASLGGMDVGGLILRSVNGADGKKVSQVTIPLGTQLSTEGLCVISVQPLTPQPECFIDANLSLQNGPDSIQLLAPDGSLLDVLGYGDLEITEDNESYFMFLGQPTSLVVEGSSLHRVNRQDSSNNKMDFVENYTPSPGSDLIFSPETEKEVDNEISNTVDNSSQTTLNSSSDEALNENQKLEDKSPKSDQEIEGRVIISEVVVDPIHDWNDTEGGNAVPFDNFFGEGTVGSTDEWIEVKNISDSPVDMTDWKIEMLDGTDAIEFFSDPKGVYFFSEGGQVNFFNEQESLVIGNPAGDMRNSVIVKLMNEQNEIVDEIFVNEANADSALNESWTRLNDEIFIQTEASIGF